MNYSFPTSPTLRVTQRWGNVVPSMYPAPTFRHMGVDIGGPVGSPIFAAADGVVVTVNLTGAHGYGRHVIIQHEGGAFDTLYAHLHKVSVQEGQMVIGGDMIGEMGGQPGDSDPIDGASSGSHLHFEVILPNQPLGDSVKTWAGYTVDPLPFLTLKCFGEPRLIGKVKAPNGVRVRSKMDTNSLQIGELASASTCPIVALQDVGGNQWAQLWSLRPEYAAAKYHGEMLIEVSAGTVTVPPPVEPPALDHERAVRLDEVNKLIAFLEQRKSEL